MNIRNAILLLPSLDWSYLEKAQSLNDYLDHLARLGFKLQHKAKISDRTRYVLRRQSGNQDHVIRIESWPVSQIDRKQFDIVATIHTKNQYIKLLINEGKKLC